MSILGIHLIVHWSTFRPIGVLLLCLCACLERANAITVKLLLLPSNVIFLGFSDPIGYFSLTLAFWVFHNGFLPTDSY